MAAAGKSGGNLHIEQSDFTKLILSMLLYLALFSCHLIAKYKAEKRTAE